MAWLKQKSLKIWHPERSCKPALVNKKTVTDYLAVTD